MDNYGERRHTALVDIGVGTVLLGACAIGAVSLRNNRVLFDFDYGSDPGPGLVPALLIAVLALCSAGLIALSLFRLWRLRAADNTGAYTGPSFKLMVFPAGMTLALLAYAQTLVEFGFLETTIIFTAVWCLLIGVQDNGKPTAGHLALYAAEAIAITGGIYLVFAKLIQVPLP